jgi:hypothetical protein
MHGQNITIYRTFNNLVKDSNIAMHTWLLSLEERYRDNGNRLPDVIYHQMDGGGADCANEHFHALCALMVYFNVYYYNAQFTNLFIGCRCLNVLPGRLFCPVCLLDIRTKTLTLFLP